MDLTATIILVAVCVVLEGFFSGTELAFISISRHKLANLIKKGSKSAKMLDENLKHPAQLYGATSLGTNLAVVAGTAVTTSYIAAYHPGDADLRALLIMTPVTLLFGEIFPKALFQRWTNSISYIAVYPFNAAQKIFAPFLWISSGMVKAILGIAGVDLEHDVKTITHEEIRRHFAKGEKTFDLHPDEKKMIHRIFQIKNTTTEQCMVPLIDITAVHKNESINSARARLHLSGHSRLPIFDDRIYNITGVLNAFDILRYGGEARTAADLARPAYYVYKGKKTNDLLAEMQRAGVQIAVVVNEYSAAIGVVTREDLVEEIFGEIEDEYDRGKPNIKRLGPNRWLLDARVEVDTLNEQLAWKLPSGNYETIAGFILSAIERIPRQSETLTIGDFIFAITEATQRGIGKVEIIIKRNLERESA
ncbi:MAG: hypothetical protein IEMM0002_1504 [bacterium]|nr:MAG: hypothetical protein IEMM0002_1504 [bacterium]